MEYKYKEAIIILMKLNGYLYCNFCKKWVHEDNISYGNYCDTCGKKIDD